MYQHITTRTEVEIAVIHVFWTANSYLINTVQQASVIYSYLLSCI